jgi:hypothetical protein
MDGMERFGIPRFIAMGTQSLIFPRGGPPPRFVGNPHGEPRYVKDPMSGAHVFATEADAEAARRSGEEAHKLQDMQTIGRE